MMRLFPKPHLCRPKFARLPKGKLVTVAAGLLSSDGMVLCADTEEAISEDRKGTTASKIRTFKSHTLLEDGPKFEWTVGVAGAGHSDWVLKFSQDFDDRMLKKIDRQKTNFTKFGQLLEEYNQGFFERYIKGYAEDPSQRPQAHMLVLVQFSGNPLLRNIFRINDNLVLSPEVSDCIAVGKGAAVFQSLADRLLNGSYTMAQMASIAVYIMDRVKSEVPGVGGNTHIVMIGPDGIDRAIPTRRVKELEFHHADVEFRMDSAFAEELI